MHGYPVGTQPVLKLGTWYPKSYPIDSNISAMRALLLDGKLA